MITTIDPNQYARRELRKLAKAQQRLLLETAPPIPGYDVVLKYRPSYVATGDYYDFFERPDGKNAVFIGDGSGHGPSACMLMATMRALLRTHPHLHRDAGTTLTATGAMFRELIPSDMFMTAVYLILGDGEVIWSAAGHHPPLRMAPDGEIRPSDLDQGDVPLGIHVDFPVNYASVRWSIEPGERLLLFTDGLYEAQNRDGEKFGRDRLVRCMSDSRNRPLGWMVQSILDRVSSHLEGADFEDDFTIIGIEYLGADRDDGSPSWN